MNNCINNILKIREEIKNLNNKICILKKEKDDIDLKIDTFDSINTINEEIKYFKNALIVHRGMINVCLLLFLFGWALFYFFVLSSVATNIFLARLALGILSSLMIYFSADDIIKTFKGIKKIKVNVKNKKAELNDVYEKVNSYGKTKEELINISYNLESHISYNQKVIKYNEIALDVFKQFIINYYVKNNINFKTLKEATKVKKLSK